MQHLDMRKAVYKPLNTRQRRRLMEDALERLLAAAEGIIADLDMLDGDTELEPECEDEGAQCEDEGGQDDREPDYGDLCNWQDEGDQSTLRSRPVHTERRAPYRSPYQNIGAFVPVRAL